jgi:hypothetical protein
MADHESPNPASEQQPPRNDDDHAPQTEPIPEPAQQIRQTPISHDDAQENKDTTGPHEAPTDNIDENTNVDGSELLQIPETKLTTDKVEEPGKASSVRAPSSFSIGLSVRSSHFVSYSLLDSPDKQRETNKWCCANDCRSTMTATPTQL